MKLAIIDKLGLCYDGDTLSKQGLGGSESAVILISKELSKIGFEVTVYNNCKDGSNSKPGLYDGVRYIDNTDAKFDETIYDIVIVSRTVAPFISGDWNFILKAKKRILWLHDTFIEGDHLMEDLVVSGTIDHVFTLSDWHTSYILTCAHGKKRNYEVLKKKIFQTRNGTVCHIPEVDLKAKDPNQFVYNASATKGMIPLVEDIWPKIKERLPQAKLTVIGGYYRFREGSKPDEQENTVSKLAAREDLKNLDITFTGVIPQYEIAKILAKSWMMLYPGAFPETFGISSLESLLYKTPLMTTRFGALEETAVDLACYHIDYAIEPNVLFPHINKETQVQKFIEGFFQAYSTPYLHQQKQNYCDVVKDIAGWDTVALQWKQFFYKITGNFLSVSDYQNVTRINDKVSRVFGRTGIMPAQIEYKSHGEQKRIVVISPFWNAENYIQKNILSVAQQNYENYIHVLFDDASTDNSYQIAKDTISSLPEKIQNRFRLIQNDINVGAIANQISGVSHCNSNDIAMLLDGDDWLVNNNTIFHYYNDLYNQGYEFTYGSMWSVVDNIPLISQEYPIEVKKNRSYRNHHFNWKIPYTHLRTCLAKYFLAIDVEKFKVNGTWMKSGADNPLFYELIEQVDPEKIYCNREIVCNYNDANPLNDYKINGDEQTRNAERSYSMKTKTEKFSVVIPTMWRETIVFRKALQNYLDHDLVDEVIIIDNDKNANPEWDILNHPKVKLHQMDSNIFVNPAWNLGVSLAKNDKLIIANDDIEFDTKLLDKIHPRITPENGVHGIITGEAIFQQPPSTDYSIDFKEWEPGDIIHCFGQLMFLHKSNWHPIDERLKIYFGDDIIFHWHLFKNLKNYMIYNIKFYSPMAATTKDKSITEGRHDIERPFYIEWASRHPLNFNMVLANEYRMARGVPSDINEHVETLKRLCDKVESVTEFGVRTGISTRGILMSKAKKIRSYDLYLDNHISYLFSLVTKEKDAKYEIGNSLTIDIEPTDLLFIDTDHTYEQVKTELDRHHSKVNKYICFHDTHSYGIHVDDSSVNPGIMPAIMEFMRDHPEWKIDYFTTKNNGFTVLKKEEQIVKIEKKDVPKKKILVGIPTNKYIEPETLKSLWDLTVPEEYELDFQYFYGYQIDQIRNLIAEWAKRYDYLFSVDSDIVLPKDTLVKMLEADKDIISGLYIQRIPDRHTLEVYMDTPNGGCGNIPYELIKDRGVVEIAACGMGCSLIKGDVFRKLDYPHFVYKSAIDHKDTVSEDVYFCMKARAAGFKVWADASIMCDHKGSTYFKVETKKSHLETIADVDMLPKNHANYLKTMNIQPKVVYDIGACVLHWTRKAKEVWGSAEYYLMDATSTVQPFLAKSGHEYAMSVLSDQDGKLVDFYENADNPGGNSYYKETTGAYTDKHKIRKMTITLDTLVKQNNWKKPNLIKMDVQGAEMDILKGAKETLSECTDLILECQYENYNDGAPKFAEMVQYLESIGYYLVSEICRTNVDGDYHFKRR